MVATFMIGRLSGHILSSRPDEIVVDVHGVGYQLHIPLSTFYRIAKCPEPVGFYVHTYVREDAIQLFGFFTEEERTAFQRLIAISGVGPKIALAVLSGVGVADLERAIRDEDRGVLERIPGIGRKTAERVLLELRERPTARKGARRPPAAEAESAELSASGRHLEADAASALVHLGYSEDASERAIAIARRDAGADATLEELLRAALKSLVRAGSSR
jgi:Holliday junction DNA helicase RuvA